MNNVSLDDKDFLNSNAYIDFLKDNSGKGFLKIRAYSANQAIPVKGVKILVSKKIDGFNVNFYEGYTNESGVIEKISLPAPKKDSNDLIIPKSASYEISAILNDNVVLKFEIKVYDELYVIQNISVIPKMNNGDY